MAKSTKAARTTSRRYPKALPSNNSDAKTKIIVTLTPIKNISKKGTDAILYGISDSFQIEMRSLGLNKTYNINFEGIVNFLEEQHKKSSSPKLKRWAANYMNKVNCKICKGTRLNKESQYFKIDDKNISEVCLLYTSPSPRD